MFEKNNHIIYIQGQTVFIQSVVIPEILLWDLAAIANGSLAMLNNSGDNRSPCLHPRFIFIVFEMLLIVSISA